MSIISRLKAKYHHSIARKYIKTVKRKQFNLTIAEEVITGVKLLASILHVPRYVITEHLLQVGSYHILAAIKDEDKKKKLEEHLVKVHLLGSELGDNEDILTFRTEY